MKYVLDASVGIKWVMNEVDADKARLICDEFRNAVHELIAPDWTSPLVLLDPFDSPANLESGQ